MKMKNKYLLLLFCLCLVAIGCGENSSSNLQDKIQSLVNDNEEQNEPTNFGQYNNKDGDGFLNLRKEANASSEIIRKIPLKETFIILHFNQESWSKIQTKSGDIGYVKSDRIIITTGSDFVSATSEIETPFDIDNKPNKPKKLEKQSQVKEKKQEQQYESYEDNSYHTPSSFDATIVSDFNGYKHGNIFKLDNGQIWEQTEYYIWIYIWTRPRVTIYQSTGTYKLSFKNIDHDVSVKRIK